VPKRAEHCCGEAGQVVRRRRRRGRGRRSTVVRRVEGMDEGTAFERASYLPDYRSDKFFVGST
jgi:hypothetical protein